MLPLGTPFVVFFAVAVPAILLMAVWAGVMAFRLLFPEEPPALPAHRARQPGARPVVRYRDIAEDQARRVTAGREVPDANPLFDDLWIRRN